MVLDLHGKRINTWQYRRLMQKLLEKAGFQTMLTDDLISVIILPTYYKFASAPRSRSLSRFEAICYQGKSSKLLDFYV